MPEPRTHAAPPCPIVVTGVAAAASLGVDAESIWRGMLDGRCGIGPMPDLESPLPPGSEGGQAAALPPGFSPSLPREARYLRWTVEQALRDARAETDSHRAAARRVAVLGTTLHGIRAGGRYLRSGRMEELRSFLAGATSRLALEGLGIGGGALTTCSACSSSLGAIALGVTLLETGQADLVVAGGYDAISEYAWAGFNSLRLIAPGPLRPFCRDRQGMKVAEGYGIVILERERDARLRGATVRAIVAGWGESADAHHLTQPHPQGEGALAAMQQALARASVRAEQLGMIAAHATGTPDNDGAEYQALSRLLGDSLPRVPVVGFKSFLGHTLGGAGAVELVLSSMALRDNRVPACANVKPEDVEFAGLQVACGRTSERDVRRTLNTSLGFGGANTCVVLAEPRRTAAPSTDAGSADCNAVITGVGVILPGAIGPAAFARCLAEHNAHGEADQVVHIDEAALSEHLNARRARRLSQYVKFTIAAATMAVRDAGLGDRPDLLGTTGAILGSMHGSASFCYDYYAQIVADGALAANPVLFAEGVPNAAAAHLSTTLGLKGACQTIIGSRTSGLDALALAGLRVRSGATEALLVVAAEAPCDVVDRAYQASGLMQRPADGSAAGPSFTRGTGGVAFLVESDRSAAARGVAPYATLRDCAWASPSIGQFGGPSAAVASALARVPAPGEVIGTGSSTWLGRAEALGLKRSGAPGSVGSMHRRFGELFSVSPLATLAAALAVPAPASRCSILCTDWSGTASVVSLDHGKRRIGAP